MEITPFTYIQKWFPENGKYQIKENTIGHSQSKVFLIEEKNAPKYVLKCNPIDQNLNLQSGRDNLLWLEQKLLAPKLEWYKQENGWEWLLMTYLEGIPAYEFGRNNEEEMGRILGETLRKIHQIPFDDFPHQNHKLTEEIRDYEQKYGLLETSSKDWDLVLSHGDYCLPNILFKPDKSTGIIDVGDIGIYDRYYDIFWGIWSMKYNKVEKGIEPFLSTYGIEELDQKKLDMMEYIAWKDE